VTQRRTRASQFLTELDHLNSAITITTSTITDGPYQGLTMLEGWYKACGEHHSHGHHPINYEPAVTSSSEPAMPALDRDDKQIEQEIRQVWEHLRSARVGLDRINRLTRARTTPTKRLEDPQVRPCANSSCTHVHSMIGQDRPADSTGRCMACYKYWKRTGREWTIRSGSLDVATA
jgi:hypothetical protein